MGSNGRQGRVRRTPAQWRRLVDEYAQSGVGVGQFCRERGLSMSSFRNWRHKLGQLGPRDAEPAGFVELAVPSARESQGRLEVELELGDGIVLRLRRR